MNVNLDPTVFVVDDDGFMRALLLRVFQGAGIAARAFASGHALLTGADLRSRCVLLLDVRMPDMSGPELYTVLRERGIEAPVIFLTASGDVPTAVAAMRNGAADFLEKPFHNATLIERVRQSFAPDHGPASSGSPAPNPAVAMRFGSLTPREREVLQMMVTGATSKIMARQLGGSFRTIETHRGRVMTKMAATSLAELVRMNIALGILP